MRFGLRTRQKGTSTMKKARIGDYCRGTIESHVSSALLIQFHTAICVRTKIFIAERLSLFVRVLALPQRVVFHHFSPLLHASRPSLLHAFMVVNALFAKEVGSWGGICWLPRQTTWGSWGICWVQGMGNNLGQLRSWDSTSAWRIADLGRLVMAVAKNDETVDASA